MKDSQVPGRQEAANTNSALTAAMGGGRSFEPGAAGQCVCVCVCVCMYVCVCTRACPLRFVRDLTVGRWSRPLLYEEWFLKGFFQISLLKLNKRSIRMFSM